MNALLDLETKLTILSNNPCPCAVCVSAAGLARQALRSVSPSARVLLDLAENTPEFRAAEATFHADEIARLQAVYDSAGRGRCERLPAIMLDASAPPAPPQDPTALPAWSDQLEFYRKHQMKPRMAHRRSRIELKKNPRVPGSYIIK